MRATVHWDSVPLLRDARELAAAGHITGGSGRNWASYGSLVDLGPCGDVERALLTDPQTSGGLLVACAPDTVADVLQAFRTEGFSRASIIGEMTDGTPRISIVQN